MKEKTNLNKRQIFLSEQVSKLNSKADALIKKLGTDKAVPTPALELMVMSVLKSHSALEAGVQTDGMMTATGSPDDRMFPSEIVTHITTRVDDAIKAMDEYALAVLN